MTADLQRLVDRPVFDPALPDEVPSEIRGDLELLLLPAHAILLMLDQHAFAVLHSATLRDRGNLIVLESVELALLNDVVLLDPGGRM